MNFINPKHKLFWIYSITCLFLLLNLSLIIFEFYWFSLIPFVLLLIFLYFFAFDKLILLIIFLTPLSIYIKEPTYRIFLPNEPILFGIMVLFFIRLLYENNYDLKVTRHPVSIAIIINIIWIFLTSVTSQIPLVSFKFFTARLWFLINFYFIMIILFKDFKNIKRFIWLYAISMVIVIGYTIYNHSQYHFNEITSHWVMTPFFNDHTAYAASIAFLIPVFIFFSFNKSYSASMRILSFIFTLIFFTGIILSYTRAAWLSLLVAFLIFLFVVFKVNYKTVLLIIAALVTITFLYQNDILYKIGKNRQQSSGDIVKHLQSISNITNDASNLERINRWHSAIRIFKDFPVFGTGPGTYQFLYAPYQNSQEKTIISTNAGDRGNAHSEYLGPLSEEGILGMLTFIVIIIATLYFAFRNERDMRYWISDFRPQTSDLRPQTSDFTEIRYLNIAIILGLITYCVHGILNNFLDTDKASALFWGFIGMIVAINIYHKKDVRSQKSEV
jgi:putative inorganic carbon (hco3(-)) transporter